MGNRKEIFNTSLIYFIILVLFVVVRICTALNIFDFLGSAEGLVLTMLIQVGLLLLFPLLMSSKINKRNTQQTLKDFKVKKVDSKTVFISILIGCIVFILTIAISSFFSYILALFGYSASTGTSTAVATWENFILSIILVAILPAICEEFTHRGFLINGLKSLGLKKAILFSSLLFGLLHLNVQQFFYASIIGIILGIVTVFSKSIFPAIIIHFMNNFINVYLDFAQSKGLPGGDFVSRANEFLTGGNFFISIIFIFLFIIFLIILLFYLIGYLLKINAQKSIRSYAEEMAMQEMRSQVLGEEKKVVTPPILFNNNLFKNTIKINIPYEVLGFYMNPQVKTKSIDTIFLYSSIFLGSMVTIFTFIWGVL
ncbi:MAG: type II CAAX endopeptidase family protein [Clostridia bacterium]|nr:type II CAAX endopeptidase family protein [Clostridia bacterium]